jgi:hypothetical protein
MEDKELEEKVKKAKQINNLIRLFAEITDDGYAKFTANTSTIQDLVIDIGGSMETITDEQYRELANIVKQFELAMKNYIKQEKIELKKED